jgi:hypothetical protein
MKSVLDRLKAEEDRLNQELADSHGSYEIMKVVFEKRIDLFNRFLKQESLADLDKLRLKNKKEWNMSHLRICSLK